MTRLPVLTGAELQAQLAAVSGWALVDGRIEKRLRFKTFAQSIAFVNQVARAAAEANHHPDIHIHFNQVVLQWMTHGSGGITARDFELARQCDQLFAQATS